MNKGKMFLSQVGKGLMAMLFIACIAVSSVHASGIYSEDFESGPGGWFADNGVWEAGAPTYVSGPGTAHGGTQCAGTNLGGRYPDSVDSRLSGPSIRLPAVSGDEEIHLRFWQWYSYHTNYDDKGIVQISVYDAAAGTWSAWSNIGTVTGTSSVWAQGGADLTSYAGKKIKIGFFHEVDNSFNSAGWYIDDIQVYKEIPLFSGDFESGPGEWFSDNGLWEVGVPTSGPGTAHGGTQCAGTNLGGNYPGSVDSRLSGPSVRLCAVSGDEEIHLRFWQWYSYHTNYDDKGIVQISVYDDAAGTWSAWSNIGTVTGTSSVWAQGGADLTSYAGKKIKIGFFHEVDNVFNSAGWFIDDVVITCIVNRRSYIDTTSCPDTNEDGCPDVAALQTANGKSVVTIKDGCDGKFIRSIQFFNTDWRPVAIACIPDMPDVANSNLNGISELVVLAVNKKNGSVVARIKDALTKELLNNIWFYNKDWDAKGLTGVIDRNSNGVYELAVLAVNRNNGRVRVKLKDALTKELLKNIPFPKSK